MPTIKRVKMPDTRTGRKVSDRYTCEVGHLHPSHRHALACVRRVRERAKIISAFRVEEFLNGEV